MLRSGVKAVTAMLAVVLALAWAGSSHAAESLMQSLTHVLKDHERIKAAEQDLAAARQSAKAALGDWYPTLDLTALYGWEDQNKPASDDTQFKIAEFDLTLTQLLWDFGSTNAAIKQARLSFE